MKIAILGASRGLGAHLTECIQRELSDSRLFLSSRKEDLLKALAREGDHICVADFAKSEGQSRVLESLKNFQAEQVFYVAGGGPFGTFASKDWKDHQWALEVNLLFPARVLHFLMSDSAHKATLKKFVVVGSAIAGHQPDPNASSYAAAKHGLRGLIHTVRAESPALDVRLYEPGYMATEMLPANAWPRQQGLAADPAEEARQLWRWSQT